MAISVSVSPSTIVTADNISYSQYTVANNDIVAVAYDNNNSVDPVESNYILYNRSTDTPGSPVQLNDDSPGSYPAIGLVYERIENDRILTFHNNDANSGGYGRVVTNSGTTPAAQPDTRFHESTTAATDHVRGDDTVAGKHTTLATGVMAYRIGDDADLGYYQTWTVASGNVSFGTAVQMATENPAPFQLDLKHWTGNKYAVTAYVAGLGVRILDTTTGISEGDLEEEGTFTDVSFVKMARIDDSRMLFFFFDDTGNDFYACVGTLFGSDQVIWGDLLTINENSPTGSKGTSIIDRGGGVYTIGYPTSSTAWKFESLSVSGTTVTKVGDSGTVTLGAVTNVDIVSFTGDEGGVLYLDDTLESIAFRSMTGLPADDVRYIRMDADSKHLYITANNAGTLKLYTYEIETASLTEAESFGAASYAELDALTKGLWPAVKPAQDGVVYVFGRDGSNKQVQYEDKSGTLGWQNVGPGTATWGTAKMAISLMHDPLNPDDMIVAFYDDDIYRSQIAGTHAWVKMGDASGTLRPAAVRHPIDGNVFLLAGTAAGTAYYSPNFGVSFDDVGGTTLGTIHWFEVSR